MWQAAMILVDVIIEMNAKIADLERRCASLEDRLKLQSMFKVSVRYMSVTCERIQWSSGCVYTGLRGGPRRGSGAAVGLVQ
jgi:hypothetical protein